MLKVAVLGAGYIGSLHARAVSDSQVLGLVAVAERNREVGEKCAEQFGCRWYADAEELLQNEEVDIVDICLPTFLHEEFVLLAAKYKKHILCEKPIALSVESFDKMTEAANNAGVKLMAAQVVRFSPEYKDIKRRYEAGDFGRVRMVYANRLTQHPTWTNWQRDPAFSGGGLYDLHIHDIDCARYLFGPAKSVYAVGDKNEFGCWNNVISTLTFKSGVKAVIEAAYEMTDGFPFTTHFRLCGSKQTVEYCMKAGNNIRDKEAHREETLFISGEAPQIIEDNNYPDPYREEIEYFADCIAKGSETETVPLCETREVLCLLEAIKESLETGKVIKI